ncbi:integrin alpha-PS1 isoform X2 [Chironomus tepperi]|uniref:integrin alpha-PS1 isoform X2 n=1 Tax=Chironomus tepperi TaxID=113505 RepID=UPI00391FB83E
MTKMKHHLNSHDGKLLIIATYMITFILNVNSFNLENRLPIYKFDTTNNSYFGYSVAIHHEIEANKKWILVGAPLGKNPQPNTKRSGTLMRCPITQNQDDCEDVLTDGRQSDDDELFEPLANEIKENQWLGVSVSSQKSTEKDPGVILTCAHRYISKPGNSIDDAQHGIGLCYILSNDFSYDDVFEPCKGRAKDKLHEEYGVCQAGTSGTLLDDGTVVLGAPGVFTWRGSLFTKNVAGNYLSRDKNIYYTPHEGQNPPIDKYSYLGMSVAAANFFHVNITTYVGGAPRSQNHGQVIFFDKSSKPATPMDVKQKLDGEQFASGFGYELTTADVNGDSLPDLLVSAPFYFDKHEGGAVYVYLNNEYKINKNYDLKLTGKYESRFGLALANIGDINKDFIDDIAIGAPYEDEGVVYIYLGSPEGLSKKPSQIIKATDLGLTPNKAINTFGSYLTGGLDIDNNGYPDLVAGAYNSSSVVALLSRQIIFIQTVVPSKTELKPIDPSLKGCPADEQSTSTCFSFRTCCSVDQSSEAGSLQNLHIIYKIEAETFNNQKKFSRVYFGPDVVNRSNIIERNFDIKTNGELSCFDEVVYIKDSARDIQSPIKFRLSYSLIDQELADSGLTRLNPILDQTQADRTFEATFQKDCGSDDVCESKLKVEAELDLDKESNGQYAFVVGKTDVIFLNVTVENEQDSAYEAQLFVVHQQSVNYIGATKGQMICNQFNSTVVACTLGNPFKRGTKVGTTLRFDPSGLDDSEPKMTFRVFANSTSKAIDPQKDIILESNVVKQVELKVEGFARPSQVFYGGEIKGESAMKHFEDIGTSVIHTFQIYNSGPWKAPHVEVYIDWPYQVGNDKPLGKWLLYLEDNPIIEGAGGGVCSLVDSSNSINPLGLIRKPLDSVGMLSAPLMEEPALMRRSNKSHNFAIYQKSSTYEEKQSSESSVLNRVKRDRAMIIRADKLVDSDGKKTNIVTMDCKRRTAKCVKIKCEIFNIQRKTEAFVHIKSRLWNSTLSMDYPRVDRVTIFSHAQISIPATYGIRQINLSDDVASIETHAYPELHDQVPSGPIPLWVIIVGILVGLFLLALVAFILWKCGFFKRRRPDPTLSGNLEKTGEARPFLK